MNKSKLIRMALCVVMPFTQLMADDDYKYDYIIVGAGTAGSVLARKLSDDHKTKVLLLEAGVNHNTDPVVLETGASGAFDFYTDLWKLTYDPQYAETYSLRVTQPFNNYTYSEGRGWGGGSMHNYTEVNRGTPSKYDEWATLSGNDQWSYNNLLPLMKALENYIPCQTVPNWNQRGTGGPISVTQMAPVDTDPLCISLANGTNAGFINDWNDPTEQSTTGLFQMGFTAWQSYSTTGGSPCTLGQRSFAGNEFLSEDIVTPKGEGKDGRLLHIQSKCTVSRVLFHGNKAKGVEFVFGNTASHTGRAYAKKIILCAGAVNSAAILQRSGIGDPSILEPLGIDVIVDNPLVGRLTVNPGVVAVVGIGSTVYPLSHALTNGSANPALAAPYDYPNDQTPRLMWEVIPAGPSVTIIQPYVTNDLTEGSIKIVDTSPLVQPLIDAGIYGDGPYTEFGTEANLIITALKQLAQAVGEANMIAPPPAFFGAGQEELLWNYATSMDGLTLLFHISCTARMGTSIQNGVVDGNLNVFGVENLMVADNSIQPVNTDGAFAAYVTGLRAATILGVPVPPAL